MAKTIIDKFVLSAYQRDTRIVCLPPLNDQPTLIKKTAMLLM
jgi:hypothetical protein